MKLVKALMSLVSHDQRLKENLPKADDIVRQTLNIIIFKVGSFLNSLFVGAIWKPGLFLEYKGYANLILANKNINRTLSSSIDSVDMSADQVVRVVITCVENEPIPPEIPKNSLLYTLITYEILVNGLDSRHNQVS